MADLQAQAKKVYSTMVRALNAKNWKFIEKAEDLTIVSSCSGEDITMNFIIKIDAKREVIKFISSMPFNIVEDKRVDAAIAVCVANYGLVNGSFDFDINDGEIRFRLSTSYCGCEVGEGFFMDMMGTALTTTDRYNDKFLMLGNGQMTLQQFIEWDRG
ncbi:MAG: YbjN domain-containing protein [Candidatus Coproplasma sp.]